MPNDENSISKRLVESLTLALLASSVWHFFVFIVFVVDSFIPGRESSFRVVVQQLCLFVPIIAVVAIVRRSMMANRLLFVSLVIELLVLFDQLSGPSRVRSLTVVSLCITSALLLTRIVSGSPVRLSGGSDVR